MAPKSPAKEAPTEGADKKKDDKKRKMPQWIQQFMSDSTSNLSTDVAMASARQFLREMAQPAPAHKSVALSNTDLQRQPFYVSHQSSAGFVLTQRDGPAAAGGALPTGTAGASALGTTAQGGGAQSAASCGGELVPMDVS